MAYFDKYGVEFSDDKKQLIRCPENYEGSYTIPNGVEKIGKNAFYYCSSLISVIIPDSLCLIEDNAFNYCSSLSSIIIPNGVKSIGDYAFEGCYRLGSVSLPSNLKKIGRAFFSGCSSLTNITIPQSITSIGISAFNDCKMLKSIVIPNKVRDIPNNTFCCCRSLTSVTFHDSITNIGPYAFAGCESLESITFPSKLKSIGYQSFMGCNKLQSIILPDGLVNIMSMAFYNCISLNTIVIPNSVRNIANDSFMNTAWYKKQPDGVIYFDKLLYLYKGIMPAGTSIDIKYGTIAIVGSLACSSLISVSIPNTLEYICSGAFRFCTSLTSITIPNSVTFIGDEAFRDSALNSISIPDSVVNVGKGVFYCCRSLTSVVLSKNITSLRTTASYPGQEEPCASFFGACSSLREIFIPSKITHIDGNTFSGCSTLNSIRVDINNPKYDSRDNCNAIIESKTDTIIAGCYNTTIPDNIKVIGSSAFSDCDTLTYITIPDSVTHIKECAFYGCTNLTSVIIPENVTRIESGAFQMCTRLSSIKLPSGIVHFGEYMFSTFQIKINVPKGKKEEYCKLGLEPYRACIYETQDEEYTILLNIAKGYEMGIGMTKNLAQAVLIYSQAADKGCAEAAFHLGELYEQGDGLPKDYQQAIEWYTKAIALYHPSAETRKKHCEHFLHEEEQRMKEYQREVQSQLQQSPINKYIFFDSESNGLPREPRLGVSFTSNWPRMIQLAWIVTDENGNVLKRQSHIICPQGFNIIEPIAKLTRITTERAQREGVDLYSVLTEFMEDVNDAKLLIAHNLDFDKRVVGCELYRENMDYDSLLNKSMVCTMQKSTNFCAIPSNSNHPGYKWPKLEELHMKLFGTTFSGAHDAMSDVEATRKCYFELKKRGIL